MTNIYVGNLDFSATEEQLRQLFATYGQVEKVSIVTDRDSGQPRGFAFVEMTAGAEQAIAALNGTKLGNRDIVVNQARPKSEAPRSFGGGRGRGPSGGRGDRGGRGGGRGRY